MAVSKKFLFSIILCGILCCSIFSCDIFIDYGPSYFKIQVDSMSAPESIQSTDTLSILFWAPVGNTACQHFWDFENSRSISQLDLTLWGFEENTYRNTNCVSQIVKIEGKEYRLSGFNPGPFKIIVHQKSGSTLEKIVQVNGD